MLGVGYGLQASPFFLERLFFTGAAVFSGASKDSPAAWSAGADVSSFFARPRFFGAAFSGSAALAPPAYNFVPSTQPAAGVTAQTKA
jgi:hypothetical protein